MEDCLIIGGGVIGLSLAYELSQRGRSVRVLERGLPGQEASWAGAGLLPPANRATAVDPVDQLAGLSNELHPQWAHALREATGLDTGYRVTGSIHVADNESDELLLRQLEMNLRERQIAVEELTPAELLEIEPRLRPSDDRPVRLALLMRDEAQIRNPRHLQALTVACAAQGVALETETTVERFEVRQSRIASVQTSRGRATVQNVCVCGGAWTGQLAAQLGIQLPMAPVRGQIVLLRSPTPVLRRIINQGRRYLVPRPDGRLLIGSTEEEAGFDKRNTAAGVQGLLQFAIGLAPALAELPIERTWAGLRPGTPDGIPYVGRLADLENGFVAAGHYRGGLHLSPATARVMAQLICGQHPEINLAPFDPLRFGRQSSNSPTTA